MPYCVRLCLAACFTRGEAGVEAVGFDEAPYEPACELWAVAATATLGATATGDAITATATRVSIRMLLLLRLMMHGDSRQ